MDGDGAMEPVQQQPVRVDAMRAGDALVLPAFAVTMRGYDRDQVETYVAELMHSANAARARTTAAEERLAARERELAQLRERVRVLESQQSATSAMPAFEQLGERISSLLAAAAGEADEIRGVANRDASEELERARLRAEEILAAANEEAEFVRIKAAHVEERAHALLHETREEASAFEREARARAEEQVRNELEQVRVQASVTLADTERYRQETLAWAQQVRAQVAADVAQLAARREWALEATTELARALDGVVEEHRRIGPPPDLAATVAVEEAQTEAVIDVRDVVDPSLDDSGEIEVVPAGA